MEEGEGKESFQVLILLRSPPYHLFLSRLWLTGKLLASLSSVFPSFCVPFTVFLRESIRTSLKAFKVGKIIVFLDFSLEIPKDGVSFLSCHCLLHCFNYCFF